MSNTEGGTKPGTVFSMDKDVKDINSKYNRITCFNRMKIHAFQDHLITANTAHTPVKCVTHF